MSKLNQYFYSMDIAGRKAFAGRADTTVKYLRSHLIPKNSAPRRVPNNPEKIYKLADASEGHVSRQDALDHFYPPSERQPDHHEHDIAVSA